MTRSGTVASAAPTPPTEKGLGPVGRFGERVARVTRGTLLFVGDLSATVARGLAPGNWRRTMHYEFRRVLYQVGFRAIPVVAISALLVGIGIVLQIIFWLDFVGQEGSVGNFLVLILVREIAPVVTALIVIGRSGTVLLHEVGHLKIDGQLRMLESHGVDPTDFIVIPRSFGSAVALFVLTIFFLHIALWSGYVATALGGLTSISLLEFVEDVLSNMTLRDHLLLLIKPLLMGFIIAYIPIRLGMRLEPSALAMRHALPFSFVYSLLATFVIGVIVSGIL